MQRNLNPNQVCVAYSRGYYGELCRKPFRIQDTLYKLLDPSFYGHVQYNLSIVRQNSSLTETQIVLGVFVVAQRYKCAGREILRIAKSISEED